MDGWIDRQREQGNSRASTYPHTQWYEGTVREYGEDSEQHVIFYDDGDVRRYDMRLKIFRVVATPPGNDAAARQQRQMELW